MTAEAMFVDLYELTMLGAYVEEGLTDTAVFELFVRNMPKHRSFLIAAGLEQALAYLQSLRFDEEELEHLSSQLSPKVRRALADLRFTGDVDAVPEGTIVFENEPILRVTAPLPEAQLVETRLMNLLGFQTTIASKAARSVITAPGRLLVDFGARRAQGFEGGLYAARAAFIAGFSGTSMVLAGTRFGIPLYGTMAHSYVEAHETEMEAFRGFAQANPDQTFFLIDTYDTERGARAVVELAREGVHVRGVRIDSGDLFEHARKVRRILDDGGLADAIVFASGGLDEMIVRDLVSRGAPIDGYGIGTRMDTSSDGPYLDCAYKLVEYAGKPRRKRSEGKATLPGRKQIHRHYDDRGLMIGDVLTITGDHDPGEPLLVPFMRRGVRLHPPEAIEVARARAASQLDKLPERLRSLDAEPDYPVSIAPALENLAKSIDARL